MRLRIFAICSLPSMMCFSMANRNCRSCGEYMAALLLPEPGGSTTVSQPPTPADGPFADDGSYLAQDEAFRQSRARMSGCGTKRRYSKIALTSAVGAKADL